MPEYNYETAKLDTRLQEVTYTIEGATVIVHKLIPVAETDVPGAEKVPAFIEMRGANSYVRFNCVDIEFEDVEKYEGYPGWNEDFLTTYLRIQKAFSEKTFGPGKRTKGILEHIKAEILEVYEAPTDLEEWTDILILAFDGAWRAGHSPEDIVKALYDKQVKNINRKWPAPVSEDESIMHIKEE